MSTKHKLISNTTYFFLNWVAVTFFSMLFWLLLGKTVSPESFGIVATALQISTLLALICLFGIDQTTSKLIPMFVKKKENDKIQGFIKFSFKLVVLSSISIAIILLLSSQILSNILRLEWRVIWLVGGLTVVMALSNFIGSVHYGFQNMKKYFWTTLYGQIALILIAPLLILLGFGYVGAIAAYVICFLITFATRISLKLFRISKTYVVDKKLILKYSIPAFIVVLFSVFLNNSQFIILSFMKSFEVTGPFAVALKIVTLITAIPVIFSSGLFPITSELSVDKDSRSKQSYLLSLVFRYSIFVVIPIAFFIIFFAKYIILLFSTAQYLEATTFFPLLVFGGMALGLANPFLSTLYAIGETKKYTWLYVISTSVYLTSAVILTYYLSALGLSISYFLSFTLMFAISFLFVRQYLDIKMPVKCIGKILAATSVSLLFMFLMKPLTSSFLIAGIFFGIGGLIYLVVLLKMNFYVKEDLQVLDMFAERSPALRNYITKLRNCLSKFVTNSYTTGVLRPVQ